jgi:hypothetical protein
LLKLEALSSTKLSTVEEQLLGIYRPFNGAGTD